MKTMNLVNIGKLVKILTKLSLTGLFLTFYISAAEQNISRIVSQTEEALNKEIILEEMNAEISEELAFSPLDLSLEEAIEFAMSNNLSFKNSFALLEIATRGVTAVKAGLYEPSLQLGYMRRATNNPAQGFIPQFTSQNEGGSVEYSQQFSDGTNLALTYNSNNSSSSLRDQLNNSGLQLQIRRALFGKSNVFYANEVKLQNARLDKKVSYFEYLDSYQALALKVTEAYLNAVKAQRQIGVSESVLASRQELLDLTKVKFDLGVSTKLDVLRVEVQVAGEEESLIKARNTLDNNLDSLLNTLNYDYPPSKVKVSFDETYELKELDYSQDVNTNLKRALAQRYDLQIFKCKLDQQKNSLRNAKEQVKNKIGFNGSIRRHATDDVVSRSQDFSDRNWAVGLSYNHPLGNRKDRESLFSQRVRVNNGKRSLKELELRIGLEVRNAQRNIVATQERIKVLDKNLRRAKENLKLAQLSYEKGIKSSIEVLDAQDDLQEVNKNYINTILDLKIAEFRLLRAMGTIGIPDLVLKKADQWLSIKS